MALKLIDKEELALFEPKNEEGEVICRIWYRRMPGAKRGELIKKNTKQARRGTGDWTNWSQVGLDTLAWCIRKWEEVSFQGEPVEYKPDLVDLLPTEIQVDLLAEIDKTTEAEDGEAKNSKTSLSSKKGTAA